MFELHWKTHFELPVLCNVKWKKKAHHFCTWNCSVSMTSIWRGTAMKHLTLPEIWWHNWSQVQRLFQEMRGISAASGTLAWIKLLLTTHRNLLLRFTEAAEWIHCLLMGVWHLSVPQPPSALLTCVLDGILAEKEYCLCFTWMSFILLSAL